MNTTPSPHRNHPAGIPKPARRAVVAFGVTLFAVSLSACLHMALLVILALVVLAPPPVAEAGADPSTSLAIISEVDLATLQSVSVSVEAPQFALPEPEDPFADQVADVTIAMATNLLTPEVPDGLGGVREGDLGDGLDSALGGEGAASFFGVEARGSRFAYIVDVSGSMAAERIEALKRELLASVFGLSDHAQFTIVVYNSQSFSLTDGRWWTATEDSKARIRMQIAGLQATGGTEPLPAFRMVFAMKPRPDAVYFMTDGEFANNDEVIGTIARLNSTESKPTPIHCITFIGDGAADVMQKIARRSRGTYRHVESSGGAGGR